MWRVEVLSLASASTHRAYGAYCELCANGTTSVLIPRELRVRRKRLRPLAHRVLQDDLCVRCRQLPREDHHARRNVHVRVRRHRGPGLGERPVRLKDVDEPGRHLGRRDAFPHERSWLYDREDAVCRRGLYSDRALSRRLFLHRNGAKKGHLAHMPRSGALGQGHAPPPAACLALIDPRLESDPGQNGTFNSTALSPDTISAHRKRPHAKESCERGCHSCSDT